MLLILLVATSAFAQTSKPKAAKAAAEPPPTDVQLRAAASTNFNARCAADFRWRDITNKIGLQQKQIDKASAAYKLAQDRASLAHKAKQSKTDHPPYVRDALANKQNQETAMAGLKGAKMDIEADLKKLMGANVHSQ